MKKNEINIYIIGGRKAKKVYEILLLRYKKVTYFSDEEVLIHQFKNVPQILILEESNKSKKILKQVKSFLTIKTIYLSNNSRFTHFLRIVNEGVTDYIVNDSYVYFSIQKSINKITELTEYINAPLKKKYLIDTLSFNKKYPLLFKIASILMLIDSSFNSKYGLNYRIAIQKKLSESNAAAFPKA